MPNISNMVLQYIRTKFSWIAVNYHGLVMIIGFAKIRWFFDPLVNVCMILNHVIRFHNGSLVTSSCLYFSFEQSTLENSQSMACQSSTMIWQKQKHLDFGRLIFISLWRSTYDVSSPWCHAVIVIWANWCHSNAMAIDVRFCISRFHNIVLNTRWSWSSISRKSMKTANDCDISSKAHCWLRIIIGQSWQ